MFSEWELLAVDYKLNNDYDGLYEMAVAMEPDIPSIALVRAIMLVRGQGCQVNRANGMELFKEYASNNSDDEHISRFSLDISIALSSGLVRPQFHEDAKQFLELGAQLGEDLFKWMCQLYLGTATF